MIRLSDVLYKAIDKKRHAKALYGAHLMGVWPTIIEELVGDQASMGSRVECLRGNTLIIRTGSPVLATELRLNAPSIIKELNKKVRVQVVARLQFRV